MKKLLLLFCLLFTLVACTKSTDEPKTPQTEEKQKPGTEEPEKPDEPEEKKFTATLVETTVSDIIINVDKGDYEGYYYVGLVNAEKFPNETAQEIAEILMYDEIKYETDFAKADNKYIFLESAEISIAKSWHIGAGSSYKIIAVGVDKNGKFTTDIALIEASTKEVEIKGSIDVEVVETTATDIILEATPSAEVGNYVAGLIDAELFKSKYDSDEFLAAHSVTYLLDANKVDLSKANGYSVFSGKSRIDMLRVWQIEAVTEYVILVFGTDEFGNPNSEITVTKATTESVSSGDDNYESDGKITLSLVEATTTNIAVSTKVADDVENYYVATCSTANFQTYYNGDLDAIASGSLKDAVDAYHTDLSKPDDIVVFNGSKDRIDLSPTWWIEANKEHIVIAFGCSADAKVTTKVACIKVMTSNPSNTQSRAVEPPYRRTIGVKLTCDKEFETLSRR